MHSIATTCVTEHIGKSTKQNIKDYSNYYPILVNKKKKYQIKRKQPMKINPQKNKNLIHDAIADPRRN